MAKETVNGSGLKNPRRFNEQVNTILLIMFLIVVVVVSVKGCKSKTYPIIDSYDSQTEDSYDKNDSLTQDAILNTY